MYFAAYVERLKSVVAPVSGEARVRAPLGPPGGKGGQGARAAAKNFTQENEKSGQRRVTSGDTKAC